MYLEQSSFSVIVCHDGNNALDIFRQEKPSVVILDINLPGKNGIEICREIRTTSSTPIIVLSARESEDDKVTLLELGADDYVSKPFSSRELIARIQAVMKRSEMKKETKGSGKNITLGSISLDTKAHIATLAGEELKLTKTEFSLLEYFMKNSK
jgi:DNA-binding response OmpR family regulator